MTQRLFTAALMAVLGFCNAGPAAAQQVATPVDNVRIVQDADHVRQQLHNILETYPRSVGEILRRDPGLMARALRPGGQ